MSVHTDYDCTVDEWPARALTSVHYLYSIDITNQRPFVTQACWHRQTQAVTDKTKSIARYPSLKTWNHCARAYATQVVIVYFFLFGVVFCYCGAKVVGCINLLPIRLFFPFAAKLDLSQPRGSKHTKGPTFVCTNAIMPKHSKIWLRMEIY